MPRLLLIRPGATEYDRQGRIQGTLDIPLSEAGMKQVAELTEQLRADLPVAVYASPNQAAEQTAELIATELGMKVKTIDKLQNLDHGLWQGMLVDDVKTKQPKIYRQWQEQPETICPPQGETVAAVKQRVAGAMKKILKKHKPEATLALVAPEPLASVIRHVVRHDELINFWSSAEGCGHLETIVLPPELVGAS